MPIKARRILEIVGPILFVVALVVFFGSMNPRFFSIFNFYNLIRQSSVLMLVSLGATYVILMGSIDLSVGSIVTFAGIVTALFVPSLGVGALTVGVLAGGLAGLGNGLIFVLGRISSFLVTLCTLTILNGTALIICDGSPVNIMDMSFLDLASGRLFGNFPNIGLWALGAYVVAILISFQTRPGRHLFTIGGGETVAKFSGVPVNREKVAAFVFSGLMCGLAGALMAARMQAGSPRMGESLLMDSIAATVMGGTALTGGVGGPHRTIIGVIVIAVLSNGLNILGVDPYLQIVVKGVVTIAAVAVTIDRARIELVK